MRELDAKRAGDAGEDLTVDCRIWFTQQITGEMRQLYND